MQTEPVNPWYREPWPWFILGILGLGVFFGISILTIGLNNPPAAGQRRVRTAGPRHDRYR